MFPVAEDVCGNDEEAGQGDKETTIFAGCVLRAAASGFLLETETVIRQVVVQGDPTLSIQSKPTLAYCTHFLLHLWLSRGRQQDRKAFICHGCYEERSQRRNALRGRAGLRSKEAIARRQDSRPGSEVIKQKLLPQA
jgi:hypothetical protein